MAQSSTSQLFDNASVARPSSTQSVPGAATLGHVGPWLLVRQIGEGALSRVFQARSFEGRQDGPACYAVKFLRPEWNDDPAAVQTFCREAYVGRTVSHPHLMPILSSNVSEPPYYVAMPCLRGATLASQISRGNLPELPIALWIARQVAEALAALDAVAHLMHCDIKPSNIFVGPDGHVTLFDLGFARQADQPGSTADRPIVGTLHYAAPEMITSSLAADVRSDIYSLGVTLYESLSGRLPFEAKNPAEIAVLHREATPMPLNHHCAELPVDVVELVHEMLSKEPLRRPQTPRELAGRLAALEVATFDQRRSA